MKNLKVVFTVMVATLLIGGTVKAQSSVAANIEDNFLVKFTGTEDNYLCFQVEVKGLNDNGTILKISDKQEGELYTQNWKAKAPFQVFKIEKKDGQQLIFNLQAGSKKFIKTFYTSTRFIESTVVEENSFVVL
jgi:hypothetical protein